MEWYPISTLPNDYEPFDAWSKSHGRVPDCSIGFTTYRDPVTYKKTKGIVYEAYSDYTGPVMEILKDVTHWMRVTAPTD